MAEETAAPDPNPKADNPPSKPEPTEVPVAFTAQVEEAPDPGEDDLDELDDMLDEFSSTSISASGPGRPAAAPASSSTSKGTAQPPEDPSLPADFSAELQKEMAALLGEIDESPEMRQQLNELMGELTAGAERALEEEDRKNTSSQKPAKEGAAKAETAPKSGPTAAALDAPAFTDTIRKTMERISTSSTAASAAAAEQSSAGAASEDDLLAQMLKEMASGGAGGDGEGASEEEFSKMLLGMMEQLTNKDILYEPMKELDTKYPKWLEENEGKVPEGEMKRYKEQKVLVGEIVGRFERKGYRDEDPQDREFVVERMQKMQASGSPPADLVGDMKGAQESLGELGPECPQM